MKTFTYQEARDASVDYFSGDTLAADVFVSKYALRDSNDQVLESTPEAMHRRLAKEFARIELNYKNSISFEEIMEYFSSWKIVPQGSPMSAIGNTKQIQSLSNCFVIESPYDSYGGIMKTDQEQAQIMKRRGGVGFDISSIRPKGLVTTNAARTTDGIGVFMERFSNTCREVAQGGRRGALMMTISVHHPEIRTFINIKKNVEKVTGANISIRLTDEFMRAVKAGEKFQLRFPVEANAQHTIKEDVDAGELWSEIIEAAHASAEPGLLFWDNVVNNGPADAYPGFKSISTNPCSEIALCAYDSCRLLLLNVSKFVENPFTDRANFNIKEFKRAAYVAQRLMDDLVDLELEAVDRIIDKINSDPEPDDVKKNELDLWLKIREKGASGRRTGLGITGLGDAIAYVGLKYGSRESIDFTEDLYRMLALSAYRSSVDMAAERGAFPAFSHNVEAGHPFIEKILAHDDELKAAYKVHGRRNIALTTTAPAGSVSILTQTTSGCEPVFAVSYKRKKKINSNDVTTTANFVDDLGDRWQEYTVYHHGLKMWMDVTGKTEADIDESPYKGSSSSEIDWHARVDLQAAAQRWICHAISSTVNLPSDTSVETVKNIYMRGWESGCKGITVYRDGCRAGVLSTEEKKPSIQGASTDGLKALLDIVTKNAGSIPSADLYKKLIEEELTRREPTQPEKVVEVHAPKRPKELECDIHRVNIKGEQYLVFVGLLNGVPYEVFAGLSEHVEVPKKVKKGILIKNGKKDGVATYNLKIPVGDDDFVTFKDVVNLFDNPTYGSFTRTLSLTLRHGIPLQYIVEQLRKDKHSDMMSFSTVIARVLSKGYIVDGTKATQEKQCSSCGSDQLAYMEGCQTCMNCGSSKCSLYLTPRRKVDDVKIKITPQMLRQLVNEEVLNVKRKGTLKEAFGPYDATGEYDDKEYGMQPWNFEESHRELFAQALEPVINEFMESLAEIVERASPPDANMSAQDIGSDEYNSFGEDLKEDLLKVIAQHMKNASENFGLLEVNVMKIKLSDLRKIIREVAVSPAVFKSSQPAKDPMEKKNIVKAVSDLKTAFESALLSNLVLANPEKYDESSREFDDQMYESLKTTAASASEQVASKINDAVQTAWVAAHKNSKVNHLK